MITWFYPFSFRKASGQNKGHFVCRRFLKPLTLVAECNVIIIVAF